MSFLSQLTEKFLGENFVDHNRLRIVAPLRDLLERALFGPLSTHDPEADKRDW